jgi:hypothetical protein
VNQADDREGAGVIMWVAVAVLALALALVTCGCVNIQRPVTVCIVLTNQVQQVAPPPQYSFPSWSTPEPSQSWRPFPMWTNEFFALASNVWVDCNDERVRW